MSVLIYFSLILSTQLAYTLGSFPLICYIQGPPITPWGSPLDPSISYSGNNQLQLDDLYWNYFKVNKFGLSFESDKWEILGLKPLLFDNVVMNFNTSVCHLSYKTDMILKGPYKMSGSMFSLPIFGEGDAEARLKNVQVDMLIPFEVIQDGFGRKLFDLRSYTHHLDIQSGKYSFTNMYNGDKAQSDVFHGFVNGNSNVLTPKFGQDGFDIFVAYLFKKTRDYMLKSPISDVPSC